MSDPIPTSSRHVRPPMARLIWPVAVVVTIFFASGQSEVAAPSFVPSVDKLGHMGVFGLLGTLILRTFFDAQHPWRTALVAAVCVSGYGLVDEIRQSFTPGRSVEVADWVADTCGALLGAAAYSFWPAWRQWLEHPLGRRAVPPSGIAPAPRDADPAASASAR